MDSLHPVVIFLIVLCVVLLGLSVALVVLWIRVTKAIRHTEQHMLETASDTAKRIQAAQLAVSMGTLVVGLAQRALKVWDTRHTKRQAKGKHGGTH